MTQMNTNIRVERTADVEDSKLIFTQLVKYREKIERRKLVFSAERCSGCQFCVYSCPTNSIQFEGYEMLFAGMPLIIDHTTCCFCGICCDVCPEKAFEFSGAEVGEAKIKLKGGAKKLESCVNCILCSEICPAEAVKFRLIKKIDDVHERRTGAKGTLKIDAEKCRLCGKCTAFCDALVAVKKDVKPSDPKPFSEILLREEMCDYCGLCEKVCPNEAIIVVSDAKVEREVGEVAEVEITDACTECGLCKLACPYDGVEVEKSFEGEIKVQWERLKRVCDWESCRACLNVCRNGAWFVENGELKLEEELCKFCRACMYACPENLIEVKLTDIKAEIGWKGFLKAVNRILEEKTASVKRGWLLAQKSKAKVGEASEETEKMRKAEKTAEVKPDVKPVIKALETLKNPAYRRLLELNPEKFVSVLHEKSER